jgi:hypothetical protein
MNFSRQDSDYKRLNSDIETLDAQYNLENTDETVSRTHPFRWASAHNRPVPENLMLHTFVAVVVTRTSKHTGRTFLISGVNIGLSGIVVDIAKKVAKIIQ